MVVVERVKHFIDCLMRIGLGGLESFRLYRALSLWSHGGVVGPRCRACWETAGDIVLHANVWSVCPCFDGIDERWELASR